MRIYIAGSVDTKFEDATVELPVPPRRLFTFAEWPNTGVPYGFRKMCTTDKPVDLFLDSGAFSAHNSGIPISIDDYIVAVRRFQDKLTVYANLDVIDNLQATLKNQKIMESCGLKPLMTFHMGSDFKYLEMYMERYDYIGLGGMVGIEGSKVDFLNRVFALAKKYWPVKFHGYGVTNTSLLTKFPFYSADSSSAIIAGAFGRIIEWDGVRKTNERWSDKAKDGQLAWCADIYGESAHRNRRLMNIKAIKQFEEHLTELWKQRGVDWHE